MQPKSRTERIFLFPAVMVEQEDSDDPEGSNDDFLEVYEPLTLRTPAPVISPTVMITGFTPESVSLAWARPSTHRSPEHVFSTRIVHRDLKGSKFRKNDITFQSILSKNKTLREYGR